ncbi:MAG: hypothetical protein ABJ004_08275 [Cyclobacteriaceae bacterium]
MSWLSAAKKGSLESKTIAVGLSIVRQYPGWVEPNQKLLIDEKPGNKSSAA